MTSPGSPASLFVGLMSGTSMDGIDAVLVRIVDRNSDRIGNRSCDVLNAASTPYPDALQDKLLAFIRDPQKFTVDDIGELDQWVGECFRDATLDLLSDAGTEPGAVRAIGCHGQTVRHLPRAARAFTLQIGDPNVVAAGTGIDTVADFRRGDMAVGGEGAPLAPAFHAWRFSDPKSTRVVLNIGGIANITVLPAAGEPLGFDTGPGNTLIDAWTRQHRNKPYDEGGAWASGGNCQDPLLSELLADPYFSELPPKSTGPEYFNLAWLRSAADEVDKLSAEDVQATLTRLSACSITDAVQQHANGASQLLVCGGGSKNHTLMSAITDMLPGVAVSTTTEAGLDADWVEAAAFAWLASRYLDRKPGNIPTVTGATRHAVLGGLYLTGLDKP
jgi:anhydro-N-acetylmuramic acid kinase